MNKLLYLVCFGLGVGVGVLSTRSYFRTKSEIAVKDALDQIHEATSTTSEENEEEVKEYIPKKTIQQASSLTAEKPDLMAYYKEKVEDSGYTDYSTSVEGDNVEKRFHEEPYVISPEAIGEMDGYNVISLTLFADDILADDDFEPMEQDEIADCIGEDYKDHFGDYEADAVHIRNDIHRTDYEILRDLRTYDEVAKLKPKKVGLNG